MIASQLDTALSEITYIHFLIINNKVLILWKEFYSLPGPKINCYITYKFKHNSETTFSGKVIGIFLYKKINKETVVKFYNIINPTWEYEYEIQDESWYG